MDFDFFSFIILHISIHNYVWTMYPFFAISSIIFCRSCSWNSDWRSDGSSGRASGQLRSESSLSQRLLQICTEIWVVLFFLLLRLPLQTSFSEQIWFRCTVSARTTCTIKWTIPEDRISGISRLSLFFCFFCKLFCRYYFQQTVKSLFSFCPPLLKGRSVFNWNFGLLPYRKSVNSVVGKPIQYIQFFK